ncbi:hypothetical protein [Salinicoccus roseus]|uniref:hypothetical protein n=1 Tax=Salinicoccus roseus TaxID=45670 RepID=UPI0022FFF299|nr:hypothetical protein [Salinicoccus roseus]
MKKATLLSSLLVAGTLTFTGLSDTAQANEEEEGAKTVWGETLPAETDIDGDGWANVGFDSTWMTQASQDRITELSYEKDFGDLSQIDYNEAVAKIFEKEIALRTEETNMEQSTTEDPTQTNHTQQNMDVTQEHLASLAMHSPQTLNNAPIEDTPYHHNFYYDGHEFDFSYDGTYWEWVYGTSKNFTAYELVYLAHNDPAQLDEKPVLNGTYDFHLSDQAGEYMYHFSSDGEKWSWSYTKK